MILSVIITKIKLLFCGIIGALRRAMCCFSRRRKPSDSDLQCINVVRQYAPKKTNETERDWNSWDDSPRTVEEHIEKYRQNLVRPPTPKTPQIEPDLFSDMTPEIKSQAVYYMGSTSEQKTDFSRLKAKSDIPISVTADLEDWNDDDLDNGWNESSTEETKKLIREKRKELREQRQNASKKNMHRFQPKNTFAERINL